MDHLQTEARNPASTHLDELTSLEFVQLMNCEDGKVIDAVSSQAGAIAEAIERIAFRLGQGGRLLYVGAGTSGRLGVLDATECPPTFSTPPEMVVGVIAGGYPALTRSVEGAEDHPEQGQKDLESLNITAKDAVVGIATSGRTPYVIGALTHARRIGACTIGLACNPESDLDSVAELMIAPVVGPEVLSGSTRLKAGTATKMVLNMLSTGAMVRLGKTYGNLMVDLRATNSKLKARTNRIVRILTGLSMEEADALLRRCEGELKTALVVQRTGVSPDEARKRLFAAGGQVRLAMDTSPSPPTPLPGERGEKAGVFSPLSPGRGAGGEGDLLLGIDGGGTRTVALLARRIKDDKPWAILGRGTSGPSNLQAVGATKAFQSLEEAIASAFTAATLPRRQVAAACLGLAGAGRPADQQQLSAWASGIRVASHIEITTDVALLLAAGTPDGWGLALVAGTGSMAYGRSRDGRKARAGGWGCLLGDEGSGYALALAGLRLAVQAADQRRPPTRLLDAFLDKLGLEKAQQLVPKFYSSPMDRAAIASLANIVLEVAESGDATACRLVDEHASELAQACTAVAGQLGWSGQAVPTALAGGLLLANEKYRQSVINHIGAFCPGPIALVPEPAEGALRVAFGKLPIGS
jgi:N-acetylmuramic acid 6-phosphate etherase